VLLAQVLTTSSTDFSFQNLVFWNLFEFSASRNHVKIIISHILNPNLTKQIPLSPAHQDLSNNTKVRFQFLQNFQLRFDLISVKKSFNIQELLHSKSKRHRTKPMHPSLSRAYQEHDLKHPSSVDLITTKQNKTKQIKLPSFIERWFHNVFIMLPHA
jgi:hypothetical protein